VVNLTFADEGIDVVTVGDGDAALAHLASETPDILLADVNMPGPTGYQICEQLRANEATRGVPVILLVGSFEPFDEAEATRVGANAYLTKPFQSIKQLIAQVNELMDAARPTEPEPVPETVEVAPVIEEAVVVDPQTADSVELETQSFDHEPVAADTQPGAELAPKYFDDLGYEISAPLAEASTPAPDVPDDIENLYERSVSGETNDDLSDVGIDDEMIETSYSAAQATDEIGIFASESTPAAEFVEAPAEAEVTEPLVEVEAEAGEPEIEIAAEHQPPKIETDSEIGFRSGYVQRFPDDPSKFENTISYDNWKPADMRDGDGAQQASPDSSFATLGALDTAPLSSPPGPQPVEVVPATTRVGEDTIRMENRFETTGSSSFKFDDVDLLDLSANEQNPVEITSPVHAVEQGASKQVVTISPELIEMIAQRVVEKLSEKY
ncbi:MAG: response regulator, partial [Pyrinomonadaceae bacterium]